MAVAVGEGARRAGTATRAGREGSAADAVIRVGLTGTLGAGKSTVGRLFESWGARRVDADGLAREAVRPGRACLEEIRRVFGEELLDAEGGLDREATRRRVFSDPSARERLEAILHPEVRRLREERVEAARREGVACLVEEIPLLFEKGLEDAFDVVVVVDAPLELRRERVLRERGLDDETFDAIEATQMPAAEKRRRGDHLVVNDGDRERLRRRARRVWESVTGAGGGRAGYGGAEGEGTEGEGAGGEGAEGEGAGGEEAGGWITVDLHMHTSASHDCRIEPAALVHRAREVGLDRIAVTDHDRFEGAREARALAPDLVIQGEEVRTAEGLDLIGLFLEAPIAPGGTFREVARAIRAQGALVYLPHPFDPRRGTDEGFLAGVEELVDVVEGFNARVHRASANRRALRWARERGLPVGAGSDAHLLCEVGRGRVRMPSFDGPEAFLVALERGRLRGRTSGRWVHLGSTWARLRGALG